ncbi:hypothetical protein SAMN02949497_2208 [Methylomagnum ishizawai]|uniref:Ribonuclease VapC n=1 Tax=Methylomagnum ishizawai TaxID=1760988 RepID=A0A1Y6D2T9_9GAMM|nr:type II toxin-antitoxin system VapC family toxin [Methylomagnum ishizawai]SMF94872.1 hypothetical protein SAMN02949497_2208 [Methylomagnum ishizawai]
MFLIDTNVVSEIRKGRRANIGVQKFFDEAERNDALCFLSVVTIGELRRGVELVKHRGDIQQTIVLESWLESVREEYADRILDFTEEIAMTWGKLMVPHPENAIDKQIAATAFHRGLTVITRNIDDFASSGIPVINPFLHN